MSVQEPDDDKIEIGDIEDNQEIAIDPEASTAVTTRQTLKPKSVILILVTIAVIAVGAMLFLKFPPDAIHISATPDSFKPDVSDLEQARADGDQAGEAAALTNLGLVYYSREEYDTAVSYYEQAIAISQAIGDKANEAITLTNLGSLTL
ncbi:MAG: tetratricopeptide repeat protein [Chloroflexota bacterium]